MTSDRPPQFWLRCETHDIRFKSRSAASLDHADKRKCIVVVDERDSSAPVQAGEQ